MAAESPCLTHFWACSKHHDEVMTQESFLHYWAFMKQIPKEPVMQSFDNFVSVEQTVELREIWETIMLLCNQCNDVHVLNKKKLDQKQLFLQWFLN